MVIGEFERAFEQRQARQVQQPGAAIVFADVLDIVELLRDQQVRDALLLTAG